MADVFFSGFRKTNKKGRNINPKNWVFNSSNGRDSEAWDEVGITFKINSKMRNNAIFFA